MSPPARVLLYDGVCHLCNASVLWVVDHDPQAKIQFASLQSSTGAALAAEHGIDPTALEGLVLVDGDRAYQGGEGALRTGQLLGFPWALLATLGLLIPAGLRDLVYGWIARNRYRWFGKSVTCRVPTPELRSRFLDDGVQPAAAEEPDPAAYERAAVEAEQAQRWSVFCTLWGVFLFAHMSLIYGHWFRFSQPLGLVTGALAWTTALGLIFGGGSTPRLVLASLGFLAYKLPLAPDYPNHILLAVVLTLMLLTTLAIRLVRGLNAGNMPAQLYQELAPALRVSLLVLYAYAVLHKLNWDYLDPQVSCGWRLYEQMTEVYPLPTWDWLRYPCLLGALAIEAFLPVALAWPLLRRWGLIVGLVFHTGLAVHGNLLIGSFSSLLLALYSLYAPAQTWSRLQSLARSKGLLGFWQRHHRRLRLLPWVGLAAVAVASLGLAAARGQLDRAGAIDALHTVLRPTVRLAWFAWTLTAVGLALAVLKGLGGRACAEPGQLRLRLPTAAFVALLVFNGLSPYLGLKTHTSFAMFSNLRTENGRTNHLFMPVSIRLAGYLDDIASPLGSSEPAVAQIATRGEQIPFLQLRRVMSEADAEAWIAYRRDGRVVRVSRAESPGDPVFVPPRAWERRLLLFRAVPPDDEPCGCRH